MSAPPFPPPAPPRRGRGPLRVLTTLLLLGMITVAAVVALVAGLVSSRGDSGSGERAEELVPADVERGTPVTAPAPLADDLDVVGWAATRSEAVGVPERALQAYAAAEIAQREATPECGLSWATVAGIGRIESVHARINGARLDDAGVARPPIIGIPLDGTRGTREILDTDGGALDGDPVYDRAVGPMQFLPTTWALYGGGGDPQQIDDAARAAAAYLCAAGRVVGEGPGWWDGVLEYNQSGEYARLVWAAADRYANASLV